LVLTNFYLFTFSRYTNPQIFSVFVITFALWIFIRYGYEKPVTVIAAGFVAAFTVFFVYIMNFFLLAGIGLFLLIKAIKQKRYLLPIYFLIGIIACFLLFIVSLSLIDSNLSIVYTKITTYGGGNNNILIKRENLTAIFGSIFRSIAAISNTGFFRFQLPLLLGLVFAIPLLIFKVACKSDKTKDIALLVLLVLFMQCLQNFFALSYPFKKMIVVMPVVLIALYLVISDLDFKLLVNTFVRKVIMVCVLVGAILVCLFNFKANKSPSFWSYSGAGCFGTTPLWFDVINIVTCVVLAIAFIAALFFYNKNNLIVVKAIFVVSVLANFMLTYTVYVNNRKYQIRDCLVSLEPMLNNKIVTGWFPFSYQLYTQCEPALNGYDIDFISKSHNAVFDSLVVNRKVDFVIDKVMPSQAIPHKNSTDLTLIKVYHFDCYSYYLYKNSHK
jgi:hypothetical protein